MVHDYLNGCMSKLHHPKHILVMDEFPRTIAGKVDRRALKQRYDKRIDIKSLTLYRVKQPFSHPVKTAKGNVDFRESFFVEVEDWAGRTGISECVSFATNWYLPETWQVICQNTRQEQVQQVGKRDPPACEPDRSRHLPDVRTYSRSLRTDVGLLSLNKIPSKSVKNEQKALA